MNEFECLVCTEVQCSPFARLPCPLLDTEGDWFCQTCELKRKGLWVSEHAAAVRYFDMLAADKAPARGFARRDGDATTTTKTTERCRRRCRRRAKRCDEELSVSLKLVAYKEGYDHVEQRPASKLE